MLVNQPLTNQALIFNFVIQPHFKKGKLRYKQLALGKKRTYNFILLSKSILVLIKSVVF